MTKMTSTKPYLFKAILQWIEDNELTPHVVVDAFIDGVLVPLEYVKDGQITLNIAAASIELYQLDNEALHFSARFNGIAQDIYVPINAILGVYARENGQGMFFESEDYEEIEIEPKKEDSAEKEKKEALKLASKKEDASEDKKKAKSEKAKRDKSHLKIIK